MISKMLKEAIRINNITIQGLSDASGVPVETIRNIYYNKVKDTKASTLLQLAKALDVSMDFLMGESRYNNSEIELIRQYRHCGIHGRELIQMTAKFESKAANRERSYSKKYRIPCLIPVGNVDDGILYNSCDREDIHTVFGNAYLAIEITTNNFSPAYCKGDRILLENRFPENGERAVFVDRIKGYFRQFQDEGSRYCLKCLNGRGRDIYIRRTDEFDCIGTCMGVIRS